MWCPERGVCRDGNRLATTPIERAGRWWAVVDKKPRNKLLASGAFGIRLGVAYAAEVMWRKASRGAT
jgi:hypothetical protein